MRIEKRSFFGVGRVVLIAASGALIAASGLTQLGQRTATKIPGAGLNGNTVAITVPWQGVPGRDHTTYSGATLVLQGVARLAPGCTLTLAEWDPGDGSGFQEVPHGNPRVLELPHVYNADNSTPFTAILRVTDNCGTTATDTFRVRVVQQSLDVEVNLAIDHGLWNLHKRMNLSSYGGVDTGYWLYNSYDTCPTGSAVLAMAINGHLEGREPTLVPDPWDDDPYVDDVRRGLNHLMTRLYTRAIGSQPAGDPDSNNNGIGLSAEHRNGPVYEGGPVVDAIIAAAKPGVKALTGNSDVFDRTYGEIIQDMMDCFAWGQADPGEDGRGGWRYQWNDNSDNSAAQWWGIAAIPAEQEYNCVIPPFVKTENLDRWLAYSQYVDGTNAGNDGRFQYNPDIWVGDLDGISTTPSGMVQLNANGVEYTDARFEAAEHYMFRRWDDLTGSNRVYGMFAFAKAMRTASPNAIHSITDGMGGTLSWYESDTTTGDPIDGLARHLVNTQQADGSWDGSGYAEDDIATAWAIGILTSPIQRPPVAVCEAEPEVTGVNESIDFDGSGSYHLEAPKQKIVAWEWDLDDDGLYGEDDDPDDAVGHHATRSFPALGTYKVGLRVWDDRVPALFDTAECSVEIVKPPIPPNANPGGPYCFVLEEDEPFIIDGSGSSDLDGVIVSYGWDYDPQPLDKSFDDADTPVLDLTDFFTNLGPGTYDVGLLVIDNDDLDNTDYATVNIVAPGGECPVIPCACGECDAIVIVDEVNFSELDGGPLDEDGLADGVLMINGLVIEGWGKILVDVPSAEFLVNGDVILSGEGKIDNYSWFLPEFGPSITVKCCGSIMMYDRSRIRSHGGVYGGHIKLCAEGDIVMEFLAGIECNGFDLPEGEHGGFIDIFAGGRFDMASELTYITVESFDAGQIHIAACSTDDRAVSLKGRLLADGTDPGGVGGDIIVDVRNGGLWLPGVDHCLAVGDAGDGTITLYYRTVFGPEHGADVQPDPTIVFDGPNHGPCACTNNGGGTSD